MSQYLPRIAVFREMEMQAKRRSYGLKTGHYTAYPNANEDHFVVLTYKLQDESFKATLDQAIAQIKQLREAQLESVKRGIAQAKNGEVVDYPLQTENKI